MTPVKGIPANQVAEIWPTIIPLVKTAMLRDPRDPEDILTSLECEQAQLFATPSFDCILMTDIPIRPREKVLNIFLAAGKLPADYPLVLTALEGWAISLSCDAVEVKEFRRGWERELTPLGYRKVDGILRKELRQ